MMDFTGLLFAGFDAVVEYASAHVLTCLVPAFFIAGAMSALLPKEKIVRYLGQNVPKYKAYPLAVIGGLLLAVCSCTVLPLFAGIKKKGAGIGPALAFLYTAPATNILAITFTGSVLGWDFAFARILLSVIFAIAIGLIISKFFGEDDGDERNAVSAVGSGEEQGNKNLTLLRRHRLTLFFTVLISVLIVGTRVGGVLRYVAIGFLIVILALLGKLYFTRDEMAAWLSETWIFTKKIFPLLLAGIFIAGVLSAALPENFLATHLGSNTIPANLMAVLFGVFMYFPTLVEVPMAKMFLSLGMAKGPLLAYLLADPVISLASVLVVRKLIGNKRTLAYVLLIVVFTTISGLIYGMFQS
ncbi:MAG: permease [Candidatus Altiarchaeota archaeon]|nr:permease [Candidatus Altiarchaeota archaeon]